MSNAGIETTQMFLERIRFWEDYAKCCLRPLDSCDCFDFYERNQLPPMVLQLLASVGAAEACKPTDPGKVMYVVMGSDRAGNGEKILYLSPKELEAMGVT